MGQRNMARGEEEERKFRILVAAIEGTLLCSKSSIAGRRGGKTDSLASRSYEQEAKKRSKKSEAHAGFCSGAWGRANICVKGRRKIARSKSRRPSNPHERGKERKRVDFKSSDELRNTAKNRGAANAHEPFSKKEKNGRRKRKGWSENPSGGLGNKQVLSELCPSKPSMTNQIQTRRRTNFG